MLLTMYCGDTFFEKRRSRTFISLSSCTLGNLALSAVLNFVLSGKGRNLSTTGDNQKPNFLACSINSF